MGNFDFDFSTKSIVLTFSIDVKITISNNLENPWNNKRTKEYCLELGHCTLFSREVKIRAWFWFMAH